MQTKKMIPVHNSQVPLQIMKVFEAISRPQIMQSLAVPMSGGPGPVVPFKVTTKETTGCSD